MKAIILAAGEGRRLRPLTDNIPKCMVSYKDRPIINYILETFKECKITDIIIVAGYCKEALKNHLENKHITYYQNDKFNCTNMVSTLFCAEKEFTEDLIISYADIIYSKDVLNSLINSSDDFSVIIDCEWKSLWENRMDNPLDDVESLKLDKDGNIINLGYKVKDLNDVEGQYIGLVKISKKVLSKVVNFYKSLDRNAHYQGQDFNNMYMTTFIQLIIDRLLKVKAVPINGGWIEIDSINDLNAYSTISFNWLES